MRVGIKKLGHNYFGCGKDGAVTVSSNTDLTSSTDGDFVIKEYTSLTINSGQTLSVSNRCKGLIIYVQGNLTVDGTISMTGKGPNLASPSEGIYGHYYADSSGVRGLPNVTTSAATGGSGGGSAVAGTAGVTNQTGGGGGGGAYTAGIGGNGSAGTCFGGGSGGGGAGYNRALGSFVTGGSAGANSGPGGSGAVNVGGGPYGFYEGSGGGAGNPGGSGNSAGGGGTANNGEDGVGGYIEIIVGGNITIGASGVIAADGKAGGNVSGHNGWNVAGSGSGGGRVIIKYAGTYTNNGSVRANGGSAGVAVGSFAAQGTAGGAGTVTTQKVSG